MQILTAKGQQTEQKFDSFNNEVFSFHNFFKRKDRPANNVKLLLVKRGWVPEKLKLFTQKNTL